MMGMYQPVMFRSFAFDMLTSSPSEIKDLSVQEVGDILGAMSVKEPSNASELSNEIEEFFRLKFRKISLEDATDVTSKMVESSETKIQALDNKFWVWETLEECIRPSLDELDEDELIRAYSAFALNMKGSEGFHAIAEDRFRYHHIKLGELSNPVH